MADGSPTPRFGDVAPLLVANGYEPLPLHFGEKRPCAGDEWQHYRFHEADMVRFADAGCGLLTGNAVGIDIDVREEKLARKLEDLAVSMFGPAPRRVGQAPKVLLLMHAEAPFTKRQTHGYRLPGDGPEDKLHKVEILAQGQQFVAFNQHPDTGRPYEWNGIGDPLKVPIGLLPLVSEAGAREYLAAAEKVLADHGHAAGRLVEQDEGRTHEPNEEQRASDPALLRQALAALPNPDLDFDDWMRVLYATKGALGDDGLDDFLHWSAKSAKDRPELSAHEYRAARPTKIGAGTIYYLAQLHGWKRPGGDAAARQRIAELAKLSRIAYDRIRVVEAEALGIRVSTLDTEVAKLYPSDNSPGVAFSDPESWLDTVDGAVLLEELRGTIERYVVLPAHAAVAIALWTLHAWAYAAFYGSPYLLIRSPQKRCGKTTLLTVLRPLLRRPLIATSVSTPVIYRAVEQYQPTLVLDEVDAWMRENEEMRAVLCGGTTRSTARVLRIGGENRDEIQGFSTFCPKVFAGIGRLVDTLEDRSIIVKMQRKRPTDRVARLREDRFERDVADTQSRCRRWSEDQLEALRGADPPVPAALNDRAADNWRPLLAIADLAGGDWPRLAREAAIALSGQTDDEAVGVLVLADIRDIFTKEGSDRLESAALVESLAKMEERPWPDWKQGKPITPPQLARLLRLFEIAPRSIAIDSRRPKGYLLAQFEDAFSRYLPEPSPSATGDQEAF